MATSFLLFDSFTVLVAFRGKPLSRFFFISFSELTDVTPHLQAYKLTTRHHCMDAWWCQLTLLPLVQNGLARIINMTFGCLALDSFSQRALPCQAHTLSHLLATTSATAMKVVDLQIIVFSVVS